MVELYVDFIWLFLAFCISFHFIDKMYYDDTVCRLTIKLNSLKRVKKFIKKEGLK